VTVREQEAAIRLQNFESAFAWDVRGTLILAKSGEQYKIIFTDDEITRMAGAVLTHNHPRGLEFSDTDPRSFGNSFSIADMNLACVACLSELRVVTPRLRFSLKPPPTGWNEEYWENTLNPVYLKHRSAVSQELPNAVRAGTMTLADAEARHFHEICLRVAVELALPYLREEG
jgi:hypothetical protein